MAPEIYHRLMSRNAHPRTSAHLRLPLRLAPRNARRRERQSQRRESAQFVEKGNSGRATRPVSTWIVAERASMNGGLIRRRDTGRPGIERGARDAVTRLGHAVRLARGTALASWRGCAGWSSLCCPKAAQSELVC